MFDKTIYSSILGLSSNWNISNITEDKSNGLMELHIKSSPDSVFKCSICGSENRPARILKKRWLYKNRLKINFYVSLHSPQIDCKICGDSHSIAPWKPSELIQLISSESKKISICNSFFLLLFNCDEIIRLLAA